MTAVYFLVFLRPALPSLQIRYLEVLRRVIWDDYIRRSDLVSTKYCREYLAYRQIILARATLRYFFPSILFQYILLNNRIRGLSVVQDGYYDQWLKVYAVEFCGKPVFLPESRFGFSVYSTLSLSRESEVIKDVCTNIPYEYESDSLLSIDNRLLGCYRQSSLSSYLSSVNFESSALPEPFTAPSEQAFILFLHVFADAPNIELEPGRLSPYCDHYHFLLDSLDFFSAHPELTLYIRPHPASLSSLYYSRESSILESIRSYILSLPNVHFTATDTCVRDFVESFSSKPVGITGRGSVSVELATLGVPVLNYFRSVYTELGISTYLPSIHSVKSILNAIRDPGYINSACQSAISYESFVLLRQKTSFLFDSATHEPLFKQRAILDVHSV